MVEISKNEAKVIREQIPDASIKKTIHKYYAEESPAVLALVKQLGDSKGACAKICAKR